MYLKFELNLIEKDNFRLKIVYFFQTFKVISCFARQTIISHISCFAMFCIANNTSGTLLNANAGIWQWLWLGHWRHLWRLRPVLHVRLPEIFEWLLGAVCKLHSELLVSDGAYVPYHTFFYLTCICDFSLARSNFRCVTKKKNPKQLIFYRFYPVSWFVILFSV
jgi:hypothetical protein